MPRHFLIYIAIFAWIAGSCRSIDYSVLRKESHSDVLYGEGSITGFISDRQGEHPVSMALITLSGSQRAALSDSIGHYQIVNLMPGHYCIGIEARGFRKIVCCPVDVYPNQALRLDLGLDSLSQ
jgi:hypothetical protein